MLEEAINAQQNSMNGVQVNYSSQNDKDGVFQLTTLSALPLKSPKRLIALQLANNNPLFRERFRQKLEQSGGPLNTLNPKVGLGQQASSSSSAMQGSMTMHMPEFHNNLMSSNLWSQQSLMHQSLQLDDHGNYTVLTENDIEKFMQSPDLGWGVDSDSDTEESYSRGVNKKHSYLTESKLKKEPSSAKKDSAKKDKNTRRGKGKDDMDDDGKKTGRPRKRRDDNNSETEDQHNHLSHPNDGSIIKRRRKGELQIMVDGGLGLSAMTAQPGPLTTAIKNNNLHSLVGGGIGGGEMGPPGETPRRSGRLKNAPLSSLSNLNPFGYLDSPFLDKNMLFPDAFGAFGADTPSRLMHLDPPLSKTANTTTGDSVRFDFDEAVAAHFPSPRAGEHIKGSSPSRWSGGSVGSVSSGFFSFPDGVISSRGPSLGSSFNDGHNNNNSMAAATANNTSTNSGTNNNIYAKKFKKPQKKDSKRDSTESNISNLSDLSGMDQLSGLIDANQDNSMDDMMQSPEPMQSKSINTGSSSKVRKYALFLSDTYNQFYSPCRWDQRKVCASQ